MRVVLVFLSIFSLYFQGECQTFKDSNEAFPVCSYQTFHFESSEGCGLLEKEFFDNSCLPSQFKETNATWLKWKSNTEGFITFVISPFDSKDDIDFIVFSKKGFGSPELLRCMASGEEIGSKNASDCLGETGLKLKSTDEFENQGCKFNDDNFLKYIQADTGEEFFLLINNYSTKNGFSISIEGSSVLDEYNDCKSKKDFNSLEVTNVFPNPTKNWIQIDYTTDKIGETKIEVLDFNGNLIKLEKNDSSLGENSYMIDVSNFSAGSYIVNVKQENLSSLKQFVKD